ncbi:hypothetical protein B0H11DRAFT_192661 [Mycena galericulata]|nr:hypothetical protein B0H11DRAFT_192661 [Mycena galericulata]
MTFGVGIGDIALVTTLVWKLYKGCKESSQDFQRLSTELASLHMVLSETHEYLKEHGDELADSRKKRLTLLMDGCRDALQDLEALHHRYESLSTQAQRSWDRVRFGMEDLSEVRQRISSSTTLLTSFNTMLINFSTARIEKKLTKFLTEVQAGMREGSVVSNKAALQVQSPDVWPVLCRELEDVGISALVVDERRDFIVNWLQNAVTDGSLEESASVIGIDYAGSSSSSLTPVIDGDMSSLSSRSATPTNDVDSCYHTARSDSSDGGGEYSTVVYRSEAMSAATTAFDAELQRKLNARSVADLLDPLAASTKYSLPPPSSPSMYSLSSTTSSSVHSLGPSSSTHWTPRPATRKRRTFALVEKLFQKPTAIIQAASDGDIDRVAYLISLGMDVNARERWGWSALSMCGYGGFPAIARLLLDHGANIDNVDIDGDTPKSLAIQRKHVDVVIMLEEEEAIRKLRASEANQR